MPAPYDSREFYDALGEAEWDRLTDDLPGRVSLEVHRRFLDRFVKPGDTVLEIGAGPGRFTLELAALGARILVTDHSPVQLALNAEHIGRTDAEAAVLGRELLDVRDVTGLEDASFDVVLAYGGPLSYAFEEAADAVRGLLRIVRPGGYVVGSVMSLLGTWRHTLPGVTAVADRFGDDVNDAVLATGDLRLLAGAAHQCQLFRADQVRTLLEGAGGRVEAMSASNWASLADPATLAILEADPERWARFLHHEVAACAQPGALDGGTHVLFAASPSGRATRRPDR